MLGARSKTLFATSALSSEVDAEGTMTGTLRLRTRTVITVAKIPSERASSLPLLRPRTVGSEVKLAEQPRVSICHQINEESSKRDGRINRVSSIKDMRIADQQMRQRVVDYIVANGADLGFTKYFWKECEPLPEDVSQYQKFASATVLFAKGLKQIDVSRQTGVNVHSIHSWKHLTSAPKLVYFLKAFLELGIPSNGRVW